MTTPVNTRRLGQVELLVHGSVRNKGLTEALKRLIARTPDLTGYLLIGYPPRTDAVLISNRGQTTAIDLDSSLPASGYQQRQDASYNELVRRFKLHPDLTKGRDIKVQLDTLTICAGVQPTDPHNPEHPLVNIQSAPAKLLRLQQAACEDADVQAVLDQLLWTGS